MPGLRPELLHHPGALHHLALAGRSVREASLALLVRLSHASAPLGRARVCPAAGVDVFGQELHGGEVEHQRGGQSDACVGAEDRCQEELPRLDTWGKHLLEACRQVFHSLGVLGTPSPGCCRTPPRPGCPAHSFSGFYDLPRQAGIHQGLVIIQGVQSNEAQRHVTSASCAVPSRQLGRPLTTDTTSSLLGPL